MLVSMHTAIRAAGLLVMISSGCSGIAEAERRKELPPAAKTVLDRAAQIELLSLDPESGGEAPEAKRFHRNRILGSTVLAGKRKQQAVAVIERGINATSIKMECFNPRHGIRATHENKTVELIICFECHQVVVAIGNETSTLLITWKGQAELDALLSAANVPLAPRS